MGRPSRLRRCMICWYFIQGRGGRNGVQAVFRRVAQSAPFRAQPFRWTYGQDQRTDRKSGGFRHRSGNARPLVLCPGDAAAPDHRAAGISAGPSKARNMSVRRGLSRICAAVSLPLLVRASQITRSGSGMRSASSPFGERLTRPSGAAVATKNMGCLAMKPADRTRWRQSWCPSGDSSVSAILYPPLTAGPAVDI